MRKHVPIYFGLVVIFFLNFQIGSLPDSERERANCPSLTLEESLKSFFKAEKKSSDKPLKENRLFLAKNYLKIEHRVMAEYWAKEADKVEFNDSKVSLSHMI